MSTQTIIKCVSFLKSGQLYSENDAYNQSVYGFRKEQLKSVKKALDSLYGVRSNWQSKINAVELQKSINEVF